MRLFFCLFVGFAMHVNHCVADKSPSTEAKPSIVQEASSTSKRSAPTSIPTARLQANDQAPPHHPQVPKGQAVATFAGGCFWCMQPPFDKIKGVHKTVVGYTGGNKPNPTYKQVAYGLTKHTEAIQIFYDPKQVTYAQLLDVFWRQIDPTAKNRQFVDVGTQYRAGIFYHNETQRKLAEASKQKLIGSKRFSKPIVTDRKVPPKILQEKSHSLLPLSYRLGTRPIYSPPLGQTIKKRGIDEDRCHGRYAHLPR